MSRLRDPLKVTNDFASAANAIQRIESWCASILYLLGIMTFTSYIAVRHMAASLAVEWAKNGVRVNSLRWDEGPVRFTTLLLTDEAQPQPWLHSHEAHENGSGWGAGTQGDLGKTYADGKGTVRFEPREVFVLMIVLF